MPLMIVRMVNLDFVMVSLTKKVALKCASMEYGAQSVTILGTVSMHMCFAMDLDTMAHVRNFH